MINEFIFEERQIETRGELSGKNIEVTVGEVTYALEELSPGKFNVSINGKTETAACVVHNGKAWLDIDGLQLELIIPTEDGNASAGADDTAKDKVFAPMPGKIVKLLVSDGEEVKKKQPLVIVEAMKMEHQVNALADGVVKAVNFTDGDQVDTETPIIELEIEE